MHGNSVLVSVRGFKSLLVSLASTSLQEKKSAPGSDCSLRFPQIKAYYDTLYGYATFCWSICQLMDTGLFLPLAVTNDPAMNICVDILPSAYVFITLGCLPRGNLLGRMVTMFNISMNFQVIPEGLHHFIFPTTVYEGSKFLKSSPMLVIISLF